MAYGDTKSYKGRGGWGGGSGYSDEGRGMSKSVWEWFEEHYTASGFDKNWLFSLDDVECHRLIDLSVFRYNLEDIASYNSPNVDSRARRLVEKEDPGKNATWQAFWQHLKNGYDEYTERMRKLNAERHKKWQEENEKREAQAAQVRLEQTTNIKKDVDLIAGAIRSDFHTALTYQERHDLDEGDWIDDVVDTFYTGHGFGEETRQKSGIKIQITVSLDLSNSLRANDIADEAMFAFRDIGIALLKMREENPNDLFIGFFTFADGEDGKLARQFGVRWNGEVPVKEDDLGPFDDMRRAYYDANGLFTGEDTWITPLFEQIEKWENKSSDSGAVRLDIVITDAVLEHPTDIREASVVQERRDGNLQTILLNFMPQNQWLASTLPRRCVQYPANKDNIAGMLRTVLQDFLAVYM